MVDTSDGFKISEVDLKLRGPGNLMGTQQSGVLNLKIADIIKDVELLKLARKQAIELLTEDPSLSKPAHIMMRTAYIEITKKSTLWENIS
jgi:ATP-dependent DNA helicase RecG